MDAFTSDKTSDGSLSNGQVSVIDSQPSESEFNQSSAMVTATENSNSKTDAVPITRNQQPYAIRVQVQGVSVSLPVSMQGIGINSEVPITSYRVNSALTTLLYSLPFEERGTMAPAFSAASQFVRRATISGGIGPVGSVTFRVPGISPKVRRVDIEFIFGFNLQQ